MEDLGAVLLHFLRNGFDVPSGTAPARREADDLDRLLFRIAGEDEVPPGRGAESLALPFEFYGH
jgi:hypothetical protein